MQLWQYEKCMQGSTTQLRRALQQSLQRSSLCASLDAHDRDPFQENIPDSTK